MATIVITGRSNNRKKFRGGFTLLELILVMVLISAVLAMVSPSLRVFTKSRAVANATSDIVALTEYARAQAVSEGRVYRLNFDRDKGLFWLTAQAGAVFQSLGNEFGRTFSLPEGVKADWLTPPVLPLSTDVPGLWLPGQSGSRDSAETTVPVSIAFYPDGRTEACGFRLTDSRGEIRDVVCSSPTEHFRVTS